MGFSFKEIKELERSRKARDEQGLFVVEGKRLFLEVPAKSLVFVAATKEFTASNQKLMVEKIPSGIEVQGDVRPERFAGLTDTKTPQGILAIVRKPVYNLKEILRSPTYNIEETLRKPTYNIEDTLQNPIYNVNETKRGVDSENEKTPFFLFLEDIQDPGNAGTILRTAEAAGVDAVFCTKNTVDFYQPKTIRSTMGSIFRVPHFTVEDVPGFFAKLRAVGVRAFAAHLQGKHSYEEEDYRKGTIFLIGNEGNGLSDAATAEADTLIRIPMAGRVESLNAAMAAGVLMFEASRQRRNRQ